MWRVQDEADGNGDGTADMPPPACDGNGVPDYLEPFKYPDADGDGIPDHKDDDDDNDGVLTKDENDADGDGKADSPLPDADADGVPDYLENNSMDTDGAWCADGVRFEFHRGARRASVSLRSLCVAQHVRMCHFVPITTCTPVAPRAR